MKECLCCKHAKDESCFGHDCNRKDKLIPYCRECKSQKDRESHKKHREKRLKQITAYYHRNRDEINEKRRNNPAEAEKNKEYRRRNPVKVKAWKQKYYQTHKAEINEKWANRRRENLDVRLANNLRARLNKALKGNHKGSSSTVLLGCSLEELKQHLEKKFRPGMTWENYGAEWHIDHIVPCVEFDLKDHEQQKQCFNYNNLQPLWRIDNLRKNRHQWETHGT